MRAGAKATTDRYPTGSDLFADITLRRALATVPVAGPRGRGQAEDQGPGTTKLRGVHRRGKARHKRAARCRGQGLRCATHRLDASLPRRRSSLAPMLDIQRVPEEFTEESQHVRTCITLCTSAPV